MKNPISVASLVIILATLGAVVFRACVIKIQPGQTGVLNRKFGGGLQEQDYVAGYYLALGPLHSWNVLDTTVQTLNMLRQHPGKARNTGRGSKFRTAITGTVTPPLKVKSSDGADVTLDITIKYKVAKGKAWRVFKQQVGERYKIQVASRTTNTLISGLGTLSTEEFFDPNARGRTQTLMEDQLRPALAKIHIDLVAILIRDLEFQESFQDRIKAKTLTTQRQEVEIARTKAARQEGETKEIRAQTTAMVAVIQQTLEKTLAEMRAENDKNIRKITADYEKYVTETRSEADLYARQKEAEGIKLLKVAKAKGEALKREALSSAGGSTLVALRTVESLDLGEIVISTQLVNPLDLDEMMRRLGAR